MVRLTDLIIVLTNFTIIVQGLGFCSGELYGFTCCKKVVTNPEYDSNGYPYGTENGKSCIVPKNCKSCIKKESTPSTTDSSSTASNGFCTGKLYGFTCCKKVVTNPEYDSNGYPYGTENGKSCIVPKNCKSCIKKESTPSTTDSSSTASNGFCTGKLYGFTCCKKVVTNPEYDSNGYPYGTENGKSCIVPKDCKSCIKKESTPSTTDSSSTTSNGFCTGKLYGFACCKKVVTNPEYDSNGYPYGTENGKSCIVPKDCKSCIKKESTPSTTDSSSTTSNGFCTGKLYGFACCKKVVTNPEYDSNGYPYGTENGKSCIVPKNCKSCIKKTKTKKYNDKGFCIGSMFGYPCCTRVVSNPEYDSNGYPYGTENGKSCIVPKQCKNCVQGFCHGRMHGFPCCTERVTNPDYDSEGNAYGKKGDESCIIPKGCTKCVIKADVIDKITYFTSTVYMTSTAATIFPTATVAE